MKTKEMLRIEFRYGGGHSIFHTVGIYDTLEEAVKAGNEALKKLSEHFEVRTKDCFKVVGLFGFPERLVSNCCYTKKSKGIAYFAQIQKLTFGDLEDCVKDVFQKRMKYIEDQKKLEEV